MTLFTVLGANGFIGSHLAAAIRRRGCRLRTPARDADISGHKLGHVFYCIGVTADFRSRPFDTVTAHVSKLGEVLRAGQFDSLIYLSSTRVYQGHTDPVDENSELRVQPSRSGDLYNISKIMGEALALHSGRPVKVARISNVYGRDFHSENFLPSIIKSALSTGTVMLQAAPKSAKDYIKIDDLVGLLLRMPLEGKFQVYNLASGKNVSIGQIAERVAALTGATVQTAANAPTTSFSPIHNERVQSEFAFRPSCVLTDLPALVEDYRQHEGAGK